MADPTTNRPLHPLRPTLSRFRRMRPTTGKSGQFGIAFWLPLAWLILISFAAIFAPWIGIQDPDSLDFINLQAPPNDAHVLGTDHLGRDVLARVIYGARVSLVVGFCAPVVGMLLGLPIGMIAGYFGGRVDGFIVGCIDTFLAVPGLVLLLLFSLIFGGSLLVVTVSLGLLFIPIFSRISRAATLSFKSSEFVLAARTIGANDFNILVRELLPNVVLPVLAFGLVAVAGAIVVEGALSFLGLSVPAPHPSWGGMIAGGREHLEESPHISVFPAIVMFLTVLSFNLVGDTLRSRFADVREAAI
ncbi:MAG: ABC transporter permease [Minwuia sp.]|nr:ABC transporter permease [Minwuia sp.]